MDIVVLYGDDGGIRSLSLPAEISEDGGGPVELVPQEGEHIARVSAADLGLDCGDGVDAIEALTRQADRICATRRIKIKAKVVRVDRAGC